jgi:polar amino acid transport system substrate-binding protein
MFSHCRRAATALGAVAFVTVLASLSNASDRAVPFSAPQAERGHQLYLARCSVCHGAQLEGVSAPSLSADPTATSDTPSIADIFATIVHRMPKSNPGSLAPADAADIAAFLLSSNGFAAGPRDLTPDVAAAADEPYVHRSQIP